MCAAPHLFDNDVISKLASCDLIQEAMLALQVSANDIYILPTFKSRYGLSNRARYAKRVAELGEQTMYRLSDFQQITREIGPVRIETLSVFEDVNGIDSGEAILFGSASENFGYVLVTGDKVAIRALTSSSQCVDIAKAISGRVICFEQLIMRILDCHDFDYIKRKIVPSLDCDNALRSAFGMGLDSDLGQVLRVLESYINEIRNFDNGLLIT